MARQKGSGNLKLAGIFILLVFGLIILSAILKFILVVKDSRFDATHRFVVAFMGEKATSVASFSPSNDSISILKIDSKIKESSLSTNLKVPIDGFIMVGNQGVNENNISSVLFKSAFFLGNPYKNMTPFDVFRLFLFSKGVNLGSISERTLSSGLNDNQKLTILSLTFTDPTIYQESKSIQIVNAANVYGLGNRLASFIGNIGGNVVLVSTAQNPSDKSKIVYSDDKSYTIERLSRFLGFPLEKSSTRGVADVIIIIGTDKIKNINY